MHILEVVSLKNTFKKTLVEKKTNTSSELSDRPHLPLENFVDAFQLTDKKKLQRMCYSHQLGQVDLERACFQELKDLTHFAICLAVMVNLKRKKKQLKF